MAKIKQYSSIAQSCWKVLKTSPNGLLKQFLSVFLNHKSEIGSKNYPFISIYYKLFSLFSLKVGTVRFLKRIDSSANDSIPLALPKNLLK
jgi:hypothetical protein